MELLTILGSLVLGTALAATCGLRAFLPLFLLGLAARLGWVELGESFEWLESAPALLALAVGVLLEVLGDKVPLVNHALDVLATPLRALAGMLVFAAPVLDLPLWVVALLALIVGGGVALAVHVARGGVRLLSTAGTAGASSPAHSLLEDGICAAGALLSILFWVVALVIAAAGLVVVWLSARAVRDHERA